MFRKRGVPRVLFTGGHHNSAVAVIDYLTAHHDVSCFWVGHDYRVIESPEYTEVSSRNIPYYRLIAGKFFRATSIRYLPQRILNFLLIPIGFLHAGIVLIRIRPSLVVTFGGYIAVPVAWSAWMLRIPVITHEQTTVIGLANRLIAPCVRKLCVAWPLHVYRVKQSIRKKMVYTGLPLRTEIRALLEDEKNPHLKLFDDTRKTLYITGGKSGARAINQLVSDGLEELSRHFHLIWSCGASQPELSFEDIREKISKLPADQQQHIFLKPYFLEDEIARVFASADLVISRAGAHVCYELAAIRKPAVLIPIPWASQDEQRANARVLRDAHLAEILEQEDTKPDDLIACVRAMLDHPARYRNPSLQVELNGQEKVTDEIITLL